MKKSDFEKIVSEEFPNAVPEKFRGKMSNVVFIIEDEPSELVRKEERLGDDETLLGLYKGIPSTARGEAYGIGFVLPDVITLYKNPILEEAGDSPKEVRRVVRETIWHEVAHHFGLDKDEVSLREEERGRMKG